jgi:peptidoglycan/xylan/chitin deacetylase (PgdA/CDA1 family)
MRKKEYLAKAMAATGLHDLCALLRRLKQDELPILAYHRVCDIADESAFPFDPELVSASIAAFGWQMAYLKERYQPVTFQVLLDALDGKTALPERPLIVTFDDGYDDNYYNAFPVLRSLGIPATIFVTTGYIGSGRPFWFDLVAHILYNAPAGPVNLHDLNLTLYLGEDAISRRKAAADVIARLKRVSNQRRLAFIDWLEKKYSDAIDASRFSLSRALDWNQVREMSAAGIEFGSHTATHPILSMLDEASLVRELTESRDQLERELGKPVPILAYPVGGPEEFNEKVMEVTQAAGYRLGASYMHGINRLDNLDRYRLRRLHVERYTSPAYFSGLLSLPEIFQ